MQPTTTGRFRVLSEREDDGTFVLAELPDEPGLPDVDDPEAADVYDPVYVAATGYNGADHDADDDAETETETGAETEAETGAETEADTDAETEAETDADTESGTDADVAETVAALKPGNVIRATLAWDDTDARFEAVEVERETRIHVADDVTGMFDVATEAWQEARAAGEGMTSLTTRSQDGDPNGALYCFADPPGRDLLAELRAGTVPIDPLIARVNAQRNDDGPRAVFLMRPEAYDFVAVYVVFERDGHLASTIRDTYDIRSGLVDQLEAAGEESGVYDSGTTDKTRR